MEVFLMLLFCENLGRSWNILRNIVFTGVKARQINVFPMFLSLYALDGEK